MKLSLAYEESARQNIVSNGAWISGINNKQQKILGVDMVWFLSNIQLKWAFRIFVCSSRRVDGLSERGKEQ